MVKIRKCLIKISILDFHIARKVTAPLRRAVPPGILPGSALWVMHVRGLYLLCVIRANQSPRQSLLASALTTLLHSHQIGGRKQKSAVNAVIILTYKVYYYYSSSSISACSPRAGTDNIHICAPL
jgi:hypothetical protein